MDGEKNILENDMRDDRNEISNVEDTACVASKTSYIDEDGLDKNKIGIYYFGNNNHHKLERLSKI